MTFPRVRANLATSAAFWPAYSLSQGFPRRRRPPDARRPPRRSRPTPSRSRCRWTRRCVVGTLPNGLRYYVRANGKPARRAELRLVVKAGSVLEDDDQQGLAHFVEHMEFEGTRHFPRPEHHRLPVVARPEHRSGRERGDELRRHAVHAARADRRARRARPRAARARGLGAGRHVRSERHRPRARHRPLGMADAPRRGRAHAGQDPARAARRIALRGSAADRQSRESSNARSVSS